MYFSSARRGPCLGLALAIAFAAATLPKIAAFCPGVRALASTRLASPSVSSMPSRRSSRLMPKEARYTPVPMSPPARTDLAFSCRPESDAVTVPISVPAARAAEASPT